MATFLSSVLALVVQVSADPAAGAPRADSAAALRANVARDSSDGRAWFDLARALLAGASEYHRHADPDGRDTAGLRAALDSAEFAFARAARLLAEAGARDSAGVLRVAARAERSFLDWEQSGLAAAAASWSEGADEVRLPPLLEELGENLLRACPRGGVLLTAGPVDTYAAWYMHFGRAMRRDLVILPLTAWRADAVFRRRVTRDLKVPSPRERGGGDLPWLRMLVERHPVCASMGFERPPEIRRGLKWKARPLLWVAGPRADEDRVPPGEFVFAALQLGAGAHDTWLGPALALYRRAAREIRGLCQAFGVYGLKEEVGCR